MDYKLGELIEPVTETNSNLSFGLDDIIGVTIDKKMIPTIANLKETNLEKFIIIKPKDFVYNPRTHGKKIGLGFNNSQHKYISTWNNNAFRVKPEMEKIILPEYLYLYFCRDIWDSEACFNAWGSSTVVLSWDSFCNMSIHVPDIEYQRNIISKYNKLLESINNLEEQNERLKQLSKQIIDEFTFDKEPNGVIKDLVLDTIGGDWGKEKSEKNHSHKVICIRGADIPDFNNGIIKNAPIRYILDKNFTSRQIKPGNLIVEISGGTDVQATGRISYASEININNNDLICSNFCRLLSIKPNYELYLFILWDNFYDANVMFSYENGTSGLKNFELNNFVEETVIYIPDEKEIISVNNRLKNIVDVVQNNGRIINCYQRLINLIKESIIV